MRSTREECLDRVIPLRERHLRRTLADFVAPTMANETTKGLGNELIERAPRQRTQGPVRRRKGIGGLLSYYYRAAA